MVLMNAFLRRLEQERDAKFTFEGWDKYAVLTGCLTHLGDPDSHIRDDIVYPAFAHLLHDGHFTKEELREITMRLMSDEYLMRDMTNVDADSVLTRSFTTLQLAILVFVHRRDGLFDEEALKRYFHQFLTYFKEETVLDGYDSKVGWKHAIAHAADLFHQFAQVNELGAVELLAMLEAIRDKLCVSDHLFRSDEDERMTSAIVATIDRQQIDEDDLLDWLRPMSLDNWPTTYPARYIHKQNVLHLLRSLYFRLRTTTINGRFLDVLGQSCQNIR